MHQVRPMSTRPDGGSPRANAGSSRVAVHAAVCSGGQRIQEPMQPVLSRDPDQSPVACIRPVYQILLFRAGSRFLLCFGAYLLDAASIVGLVVPGRDRSPVALFCSHGAVLQEDTNESSQPGGRSPARRVRRFGSHWCISDSNVCRDRTHSAASSHL